MIYGVGIVGEKYPAFKENGVATKEYMAWREMLRRCHDKQHKDIHPTYKDVTCCEEWLLFDNFYEWLHNQENFDKWCNGDHWAVDKDILVKGNKEYCPDTCCLVPQNINNLFIKRNKKRGDYPVGVKFNKIANKYEARCNIYKGHKKYIGLYDTPENAFYAYKLTKENVIKQTAQEEYNKGNIIKKCYDAMMCYEVNIND